MATVQHMSLLRDPARLLASQSAYLLLFGLIYTSLSLMIVSAVSYKA